MTKAPSSFAGFLQPSIFQKVLLLVLIPFALNCVWVTMLNSALTNTGKFAEEEHKLVLIVDRLNAVQLSFYDTLSETYALAITGKQDYRNSAMAQIELTRKNLTELKHLLAENREADAFFTGFTQLVDKSVQELAVTNAPEPDTGYKDFLRNAIGLRKLLRQLTHSGSEMHVLLASYKTKLEETARAESVARSFAQSLIGYGILSNFALALLLLFLFNRNFGRRLSVLIDNATRLPKRLPLNQKVSGEDELFFLDDAMHSASHDLMQAWNHRDALVAMVAHDLRSPLTSCEISLQILSDIESSRLSPDGNREILNIRSNIGRLIALINDLLTISKLEAGELRLSKSAVQVVDVADLAIAALSGLAESKQIAIRNLCGNQEILVDNDRIVQVIINYLSNAIKFSPRKSQIQITSHEDGGRVIVSVQDQGKGLSKVESRQVFKKFYQAKTDESIKGFGLGLAICKLIIESHEGLVGVESTVNKGSRFWFAVDAASTSSR